MLADERRRPVHSGWRPGEFEGNALDLASPQEGVVQLGVQAPGSELRIMLDAILGALHWHGADPSGLAFLGELVLVQGLGPVLDAGVHLLLMRYASAHAGEFGILRPDRAAHEVDELLPFLIG